MTTPTDDRKPPQNYRIERPFGNEAYALKRQLAKRDGARCFYCGGRFPKLEKATFDHLVPWSKAPSWEAAALVLACRPCNDAKKDTPPAVILRHLVQGRFQPGLIPS